MMDGNSTEVGAVQQNSSLLMVEGIKMMQNAFLNKQEAKGVQEGEPIELAQTGDNSPE